MSKRFFVTGATGIVGSWVVKELIKRGAFVVALVRDNDYQTEFFRSEDYKKVNIVNGRLEDYSTLVRAMNEYETDTVIHLAAQPIVNVALRSPLETFEANIRGTYNLLEACRQLSGVVKNVVVASSDKAYGESEVLPYREDMKLNGLHPYDVSKSCTDMLSFTYYKTYDLPVSVARCGNIYGGGDLNWSRIVPGTILSLLKGEKPVIRSNGKLLRDYIYVTDVVSSYLLLAEKSNIEGVKGEAFNFSPGFGVSVIDIVEKITKIMKKENLKPVILDQVQHEIMNQYLDSTKAKNVLGWSAKHSLDDGLKETVEWYTRYFNSHGR